VLAGAGILVGTYDLGAIAVVLAPLRQRFHVDDAVVATLGTVTLVGMLLGSLLSGVAADRLGRRRLILADAGLLGVSGAVAAGAPDFGVLAAARLACGLAIGIEFAVVFPFVSEVAPTLARGQAMAWIMLTANLGVLAAYGAGAAFLGRGDIGWRIVLGLGALAAAPLVLLRSQLAESATWEAERVRSLRHLARRARVGIRWEDFGTFATSAFLYQIGDQGLTLALPLLLVTALGTTAAGGALGAVGVKLVTIPAALIAVVAVERLGRRPLQLFGFAGRGIALVTLGALLLAGRRSPILVGGVLAVAYFLGAAGPDKTTVIAPAESFPTEMRASGQGAVEAAGRLGGIVGVTAYGLVATWWGPGAGLLVFGAAALLGAGVTGLWMAETRPARLTGPAPFPADGGLHTDALGPVALRSAPEQGPDRAGSGAERS